MKVWCCDAWQVMCGQNLHNLWNSALVSGLAWSAVVYPSVTLGPLTRAHQAVVYMQISQSALSQDIVNICWSPLSSHSRTTDFSPKHPCYCYTERRYLIRTSDCWSLARVKWPPYLLWLPSWLSARVTSSHQGVGGRCSATARRWTGP